MHLAIRNFLALPRPWFQRLTLRNLVKFWKHVEVGQGIESIAGKKVLVLSPHPDDESIGCGGTLRLLAESNGEIHVVFLTDGEKGFIGREMAPSPTQNPELALATRRRDEAQTACEILGIKTTIFFGQADGGLHRQRQADDRLRALVDRENYAAIFCPWPHDSHSDHSATFSIMSRSLRNYRHPLEVWLYEVWNPLLINHAVDISRTILDKMRAVSAHSSQMAEKNFSEIARSLAHYRSLHCPGAVYAEAFFVGSLRQVRAFETPV